MRRKGSRSHTKDDTNPLHRTAPQDTTPSHLFSLLAQTRLLCCARMAPPYGGGRGDCGGMSHAGLGLMMMMCTLLCMGAVVEGVSERQHEHQGTTLQPLKQKEENSSLDTIPAPRGNQTVAAPSKCSCKCRQVPSCFEPPTRGKHAVPLPRHLKPESYILKLQPNIYDRKFNGTLRVTVHVIKDTTKFVLNAANLTFTHVFADVHDACRWLEPLNMMYIDNLQLVVLDFQHVFKKGQAVNLTIAYQGVLNSEMEGFYLSTYEDDKGVSRWIASTQFEPTGARQTFPCFDEPLFKASFTLSLVHQINQTALSNMPVMLHVPLGSGMVETVFRPSVRMSTYLVAFVMGDLEHIEKITSSGIHVRIWTRPGLSEHGEFALNTATSILPFFEELFGIAFPLPKLDLVGIPDFASGAMENWGLITFRETALLYNPHTDPMTAQQRVAVTVVHEVAHQWFGNLVTMRWWDDLWLNEGFASFMEYVGTSYLHPDWEMWEQFVVDVRGALELDATDDSHPIDVDVRDPEAIDEIFDAISYQKGMALLRMLKNYIGDDVFFRGLNEYLTTFAGGNARTEDLWNAMRNVSNLPISEMMTDWTSHAGFPVVYVEDMGNGSLRMTQHRMHLLIKDEEYENVKRDLESTWRLPITMWFGDTYEPETFLLKTVTATHTFSHLLKKANFGQGAYCRINYSADLWKRIYADLHTLPPLDRVGIIDDTFELSRTGEIPALQALNLARQMKTEKDYIVWNTYLHHVTWMYQIVRGEDERHLLAGTITDALKPIVKELGVLPRVEDSHMQRLLRRQVLEAASRYGLQEVVDDCLRMFQDVTGIGSKKRGYKVHVDTGDDGSELSGDIRGPVFKTAVRYGGEPEYEWVLQHYRSAKDPQQRREFLSTLSAVRDPALLERTLNMSLHAEVRPQDTVSMIVDVAANDGKEMAWNFVKENWAKLVKRDFLVSDLIEGVTKHLSTEARGHEVAIFFREHPAPEAERTIKQSVERILANARWLEHNMDQISRWLRKEGK